MSSHRNMGKARSELAHRPRACLCAPGSMRRVKDAQRPRSGRINVAVGFNPRNTERIRWTCRFAAMFATHRTRAAKGSSGRNQKLFSLRSLRPLRLCGELSVGKKASPQRLHRDLFFAATSASEPSHPSARLVRILMTWPGFSWLRLPSGDEGRALVACSARRAKARAANE